MNKTNPSNSIILFDGVCPFCVGWVQRLIRMDRAKKFRFASLQSSFAKQLLSKYPLRSLDSIILYEHGKIYTHSTAVLRIAKSLPGWWKGIYLFILIPRPLRDAIYSLIAKNRYRLFKKRGQCFVPSAAVRKRFLGLDETHR